jgi:hypothetical protein
MIDQLPARRGAPPMRVDPNRLNIGDGAVVRLKTAESSVKTAGVLCFFQGARGCRHIVSAPASQAQTGALQR